MKTEELTFSTFLRNPREVVDRLEYGDVVLRRRGAPPIRVSLDGRMRDRDTGTSLVAHMLADVTNDEGGREALVRALGHVLAWVDLLPQHAREEFLEEFLRTAEAAGEVGTHAPLAQLVRAWRETAAIYADPELFEQMTKPLPGDGGSVPEPPATAVV
jgi:hypothetical protein